MTRGTRFRRATLPALILALSLAATTVQAQEPKEFRIGGIGQMGVRNALLLGDVSASTGAMTGGEMYVWLGGVGLRVRAVGGTFSEEGGVELGDVVLGDAHISLGTNVTAIEFGVGRRAFAGPRSTLVASYFRGGLSVTVPVGSSGFSGRILGGAIVPLGPDLEVTGFELETGIFWFPRRLPVYLSVGYRYDQVTLTTTDGERPEQLGSAIVGFGIRFAR